MKNIIKIIIGLFVCVFILFSIPRVVLYFFTKPAKPIMEYEFPNMTYEQLETKISNQDPKRLKDVLQLSNQELKDNVFYMTRFVVLGKNKLQFDFITNADKAYQFKTKKRHSKGDLPWIELLGVRYSIGKSTGINYKNKDKYPQLIKLFEDDFIKKINNGKVNVIDHGFWDWF